MDEKLFAPLVGIVAGAIGYWFTTFWMKPIVRYREIRNHILSDLIFYAQVTNPDGLVDRLKKLYEDRVESNRRRSAELSACLLELPFWYKWWLKRKGQSPEDAARNLIGFSNATKYDQADKRIENIKNALGFNADQI